MIFRLPGLHANPACLPLAAAARKGSISRIVPVAQHIADRHTRQLPVTGEGGFTLLELLVVIAILGLLAALVGPRLFNVLAGAKTKLTSQQIENIGSLLEEYKIDVGAFPSTDQGLVALSTKPNDVENWQGPYAKNGGVPNDPWNHPWTYHSPSAREGHDYDLCSAGPNAAPNQTAEPGQAGAICNP
jgi:general secretion pathway protein G